MNELVNSAAIETFDLNMYQFLKLYIGVSLRINEYKWRYTNTELIKYKMNYLPYARSRRSGFEPLALGHRDQEIQLKDFLEVFFLIKKSEFNI